MAIEMRLSGGLGNQLHQLAAGVAMAGELKTDLRLNLTTINLGSNGSRRFEIDNFDLGNLKTKVSFVGKSSYSRLLAKKLSRRIRVGLDHLFLPSPEDYRDDLSDPSDQICAIRDGYSISGHFVNFTWVEIAQRFGFEPRVRESVISPRTFDIAQEVEEQDVAVHLRFGDFLTLPGLFPVLNDEFVMRSLGVVGEYNKVWLFTDDLLSASQLCPLTINNSHRIYSPNELSGLETFWLLGRFSNVITANSTFSTWAAYLSKKAKCVVTPTPHLLGAWVDHLPEAWKRVSINE